MEIEKFVVGTVNSNSYIINDQNKIGVVIDCGGGAEKILAYIKEKDLKIEAIILTHYHFDHIMGVKRLKEELGVDIYIHQDDAAGLADPEINLSVTGQRISIQTDKELVDGQVLNFGDLNLEIIHTPGHTPGCICIKLDQILFTGDTVFKDSIGRTDLPNGDRDTLMASLKEKILTLKDDLTILPGHFGKSSLAYERDNNPYMNKLTL